MSHPTAPQARADIELYGEVGWDISPADLAARIDAFDGPQLSIGLHSIGGDAHDGVAIYNLLREHPARIEIRIRGLAASAASAIAMAGDRVVMGAGAMLMVHNPFSGVMGEADELRQAADALDAIRDGYAAIYEAKSGLPRDRVIELMSAETWLSAAEAVALGFADAADDRAAPPAPDALAAVAHALFVPRLAPLAARACAAATAPRAARALIPAALAASPQKEAAMAETDPAAGAAEDDDAVARRAMEKDETEAEAEAGAGDKPQADGDDDDMDGDDDPAMDAARAAERARIAAILDSPEAQGRRALARHLATKTGMSPKAATAALKAAPKTAAGGLDARMAGAQPLGAAPAAAQTGMGAFMRARAEQRKGR
ncbi:MAG: head maturation protease, ClpP-related [Pseudomonadota bacterium]